MTNNLQFDFDVDNDAHTITVVREFAAPPERVWNAWTTAELLDQWWAPKPYRAKTKALDFRPGGRWLYAMISPEGHEQYTLADYRTIDDGKSFSWEDAFCDAEGRIINELPGSHWTIAFEATGNTTTVTVTIRHASAAGQEQTLRMGFREGFTMGLGNLDAVLAAG